MDVGRLQQLLARYEDPKLEFKREWYSGTNKLDDKGWGEFLKDIIALANGNIGFTGKPAYLIVGVVDEDPQSGKSRETFHVSPIGMLSQLQQLRDTTLRKLRSMCSPPLQDIRFEFVTIEPGKELLVIEIPSPPGLLKLDQDLNTRGTRFRKGTVLNRVGQDVSVADPTEIEALQREFKYLFGNSASGPRRVLHNLPQPDYVRFVGRKEELDRLRKLLHPRDRIWCIVIDGVGGIGKSALALEIAHRYLKEFEELPEEERFDVIIWTSAKTTTLTGDGITPRQQVTNTIDDVYKTIAVTLEKDNITREDLEDQSRLINRALASQRTLLVIDNLETVDDERVIAFIREIPDPTKCIVTTRHRIDVADPIRLAEMPRGDALSLIAQECEKKGVSLTDDQADLLYRRTGGIPLAVVWSVAQMSYGYGVETVLHRLGDAKGNIARFCFESALHRVKNKPAHVLLVCLSLVNSTYLANRQHLGTMADLSELDRDEGLVELERLSLINKQDNRFSLLSLVQQYVIASLADMPFGTVEQIIARIAVEYAPIAADAVLTIEPFTDTSNLTNLKERIAGITLEQVYRWADYNDEMGVYYCIAALEKLATQPGIGGLKSIAEGYYWYLSYSQTDAISALARLGEIEYLIDLLVKETKQKVNTTISFLIETLGKFAKPEHISKIEQVMSSVEGSEAAVALKTVRERIVSNLV